jgi:hypothetical protein
MLWKIVVVGVELRETEKQRRSFCHGVEVTKIILEFMGLDKIKGGC